MDQECGHVISQVPILLSFDPLSRSDYIRFRIVSDKPLHPTQAMDSDRRERFRTARFVVEQSNASFIQQGGRVQVSGTPERPHTPVNMHPDSTDVNVQDNEPTISLTSQLQLPKNPASGSVSNSPARSHNNLVVRTIDVF